MSEDLLINDVHKRVHVLTQKANGLRAAIQDDETQLSIKQTELALTLELMGQYEDLLLSGDPDREVDRTATDA